MKSGGLGVTRSILLGIAVMASCYGGARAQDTPALSEAATAMIGAWEFSNADRDKICRFNFRADAATGGYKLDIDKNCPSLFPTTKDIVAWAVDNFGGLRLLDAGGNAVIELNEAEAGLYDGFEPEQGRYVLQSAAAVRRFARPRIWSAIGRSRVAPASRSACLRWRTIRLAPTR